MPSTETSAPIPAPIALVLEHHGALHDAYVRRRTRHDKAEAFVGAVSEVLTAEQVRELSQLLNGAYDAPYDATRGAEFGKLLLDDLEQGYQDVQRSRSRARRWMHLDTPAAIEAIATDAELARLYAQARAEGNEAIAHTLVASAVRVVVEKASTTRNAPETRRTLEAAAVVFGRHAGDATNVGQLGLLDTATVRAGSDPRRTAWCAALTTAVNAEL